ncbi:Cell division protein FtsB [Vibrio stylophorae]|uniref:Cell division protein FtsB n=1 Tax=Vibrio stylophorae TaxID=659351 RepID=A0ABN8DUS1_9VIBR|nr:cell division protein FtsB [Vibrio stylophorae]CAH0534353.1 Cell division protein FtsB [Vibrio stylophorae]
MRLLTLFFAAILLLLSSILLYGKNGVRDHHQLEQDIAHETQANVALKQRNAQMWAEIDDLKSGNAAIEERARHELGMIKPDEVFYRVIEPESHLDDTAE